MSYTPKRASSSSEDKKPVSAARAANAMSAADQKKKKTLTIAIVVVLCVVIAVSLLFILAPSDGSFLGIHGAGVISGSGRGNGAQIQDGTTIISTYYQGGILPTSADRHDIHLAANGGANASDLLGKWRLDQGTTYVFDGQGRGIMLTGVDNYTFLYSAENGKLGIDMDTIAGNDFEYDYSVNGDTLTMTRDGKTYTLKKEAE